MNSWFYRITGVDEETFKNNINDHIFYDSEIDQNYIINNITNERFNCGKLEHIELYKLEQQCKDVKRNQNNISFEILIGNDADVAKLQTLKQFDKSVFLVASNFDALEHPNEDTQISDYNFITYYDCDHTQGPTAALGAPAACIDRSLMKLNMLEHVEHIYTTKNGYPVLKEPINPINLDDLKLGLFKAVIHNNVEVSAYKIPKSRGVEIIPKEKRNVVDQVFAAAVNIKQRLIGANNANIVNKYPILLEYPLICGYYSAYLTALKNNRETIVLTLLGGGVFGNQIDKIIDAIIKAHISYSKFGNIKRIVLPLFRYKDRDLEIITNKLKSSGIKYKICKKI